MRATLIRPRGGHLLPLIWERQRGCRQSRARLTQGTQGCLLPWRCSHLEMCSPSSSMLLAHGEIFSKTSEK